MMPAIPIQVTFRGMRHSDSLETIVRDRVAWLERFYPNVVRCRVTMARPHKHRHDGRHYHLRIELTVPGGSPIVVNHEPTQHGALKDDEQLAHHKETEAAGAHRHAAIAIHDAFDAARRRLEDFAREQRGTIKTHDVPLHGEVVELDPIQGSGVIQSGERRIYFHRASVLSADFATLKVGTPVAFAEEEGEKGPQASTVRVLGKHHYVAP
jgi:cold shock CspA family protein